MKRMAMLIEYDGTRYAGWQRQSNGIAVQQCVEKALAQVFGHTFTIHGAGRTDAGVHASGQVAHTDIYPEAHAIPLAKVPIAINRALPNDIRIVGASYVPDNFHARFDAVWREYVYTITTSRSVFSRHYAWDPILPFRMDLLEQALQMMIGIHDFTAISKNNPGTTSYVCNVSICELRQHQSELTVRIRANRFVYGMCRAMVGAAMSVARGRSSLDELANLLQTNTREQAPIIVPAHGLNLCNVGYSHEIDFSLHEA
ncbi:MAG: tRNA pseudouridine(38-40) synthase TruA [Ignavibacteria bacterium]|nr:tRNA pseudouridine(38-40) synthase TruA [Ignavibacteria bacterium]